jgi:acyl carrier protein
MATDEAAEVRIRRAVADGLGVSSEELTPEVSLVDDLAADSLDLAELAVGIEETLGVVVPDATMARVRTYGELVGAVQALCGGHGPEVGQQPGPAFRARVVGGNGAHRLHRTGRLTPYELDALADHARRAGRGGRLELTIGGSARDGATAWIEERLARVARRAFAVDVRFDPELRAA